MRASSGRRRGRVLHAERRTPCTCWLGAGVAHLVAPTRHLVPALTPGTGDAPRRKRRSQTNRRNDGGSFPPSERFPSFGMGRATSASRDAKDVCCTLCNAASRCSTLAFPPPLSTRIRSSEREPPRRAFVGLSYETSTHERGERGLTIPERRGRRHRGRRESHRTLNAGERHDSVIATSDRHDASPIRQSNPFKNMGSRLHTDVAHGLPPTAQTFASAKRTVDCTVHSRA